MSAGEQQRTGEHVWIRKTRPWTRDALRKQGWARISQSSRPMASTQSTAFSDGMSKREPRSQCRVGVRSSHAEDGVARGTNIMIGQEETAKTLDGFREITLQTTLGKPACSAKTQAAEGAARGPTTGLSAARRDGLVCGVQHVDDNICMRPAILVVADSCLTSWRNVRSHPEHHVKQCMLRGKLHLLRGVSRDLVMTPCAAPPCAR